MPILLLAVPALLVVVIGYVVGHTLWSAVAGDAGAEPAGWITGLVLLAGVLRLALALWRRRRSRDRLLRDTRGMPEMDPKDPSTLYAEGPVSAEPPDDDLPETSPLRDKGGTGPGPDDLD